MHSIRFTLNSIHEIWKLVDKEAEHILISKFQPHGTIEWWESTVKVNSKLTLENLKVRNMQFDIQTNLLGLQQIIEHEWNFLDIYQFNKPVPDTLSINHLPEGHLEQILINNGLQHLFQVDFESIVISSIDEEFIRKIAENSEFSGRVQYNSLNS